METKAENKRLESLDALRGFDMFFITGGATLIAAIAALFPDSAAWQAIGAQMEHVPWDGLVHHDTIFPLFLFIAGISFPFSLQKQQEKGKSMTSIYLKILRRGLTLVFLGLVVSGFLKFEFETLRWPSVLGRIGLAWMFAAFIFTATSKKLWPKLAIVPVILIGYWLVSAFVHAPGVDPGIDPLTREGNIACYIDRTLLGPHCYKPDYDPEGILSTIPAIGTAMLGMLTGMFIQRSKATSKTALTLFLTGVVSALLGAAWNTFYPINKALWSSSFVLAVAGYSLIMFALFYYIIDVRGWKKWDLYFKVIGMNSILIYMAPRFIDFSKLNRRLFEGVYSLLPEQYYDVAETLGYMLVLWLFMYFMYRKKVFLKV
jgi:predicted acyltransferase